MAALDSVRAAAADGLVYLPLGGAGEIGMNFYLYGCQGKWIGVECGVTLGDDSTPGLDVMAADPSFAESLGGDLIAVVLTHAHEDHQGAMAMLWPRLACPVYATAFTAGLVRRRIEEAGLADRVPLKEIPLKAKLSLGPFDIELVTVTHSILEPNALAIETPYGRIIHTGDWKIDPDPLIGETIDEARFTSLGDSGILAMICDSTNVFTPGVAGSEGDVRKSLIEMVGGFTGRIAVACFASNVARVESIAVAAAANGRQVALVGRSLWRMTELARATGYLADVAPFVTEHDVGYLPPERVVMICTGSQGERGAALTRIAMGDHPKVVLEEGDVVLYSSRNIPGNERAIYATQERLARRGVQIVTGRNALIHVSGHPCRDELAQLYGWVRPGISVPMHGETRHLIEHADYALSLGVPESFVVTNGHALKLAPGTPGIVGEVATGRVGLDGDRLVPMDSGLLDERRRMTFAGSVFVTVMVDGTGRLADDPVVSLQGLAMEESDEAEICEAVADEVAEALSRDRRGKGRHPKGEETVVGRARIAARRAVRRLTGKKPVCEVHFVRR
jgi:ribonuclease J